MAEHEFERFLEVLSKLLKLSSKETGAVADEICDHLEERYSELVSLGISREDAVKQALDEFDDAGEFAAKLNRLVQQRTRRRIMTGALSTAAASALAILVTTAFWPDQRQVVGPVARAVAGDAREPANQSNDDKVIYVDPSRYMPEGLLKPVDTDLRDVELQSFATFIQELSGLPALLDKAELTNAGVGLDAQLTMKTFQAPLHLVLDRVLGDVGGTELAWIYDDDVVKITTREKADTIQDVTTVDVADLLDSGLSMSEIINVLETHTSGPWQNTDGDGGSFLPVGTRLTIRSTQLGRYEVLSVLEGLRTPGRRIAVGQTALNERIRAGLEHVVGGKIPERELVEVLDDLTQQAGIPFALDVTELTNTGVGPDQLVTLSLKDAPLRVVLKLLLSDVGGTELAAIPDRGVLWITTRDKADTLQNVEIFDVSDLVEQDEMHEVVNLVEHATAGPWLNTDGDGGSISVLPKQRLIVRQTQAGLNSVQRLLTDHRRIAKAAPPRPKPDPNAIETRYYRLSDSQANDLRTIIPKHVAVDSWAQLPDGSSPAIDKVAASGQNSGGGFFQIGGGGMGGMGPHPGVPTAVLVIRQTRRVHREIEKFLREMSNKSGTPFYGVGGATGGGSGGGGLGGAVN